MKKNVFLFMLFFAFGTVSVFVHAQVTIGVNKLPHAGAVLDLSQVEEELGLLLSRVELGDVSVFQLSITDTDKAKGMLVYNTSKTTIGGNGVTGLFTWDGSKWRPVSDGSGRMTLSTLNNLGMSNNPAAADSSEVISATITDADCEMSGQYQFILLAGNAAIDPVSSVTPEFNLEFYQNHTGSPRTAVVQVINPCYKTATFLLYQKGATCETAYHVKTISSYNSQMCNNGSVYAYVSEVEGLTGTQLDSLSYYWMLGNTQVATGRGASLTRSGTYTVYANMEGCGTTGSISVTLAGSDNAPAAHTMMVTNDGIICGGNAVKLQVLNVLTGETVKWFKNGIHDPSLTDKSILLSTADKAGEWYAAVEANGCWSKPTNSAHVTYTEGLSSYPPPVAMINGKPFDDQSVTSVCAGSTVRLEIANIGVYGNSPRRFYWYMNDQLVGETTGDAIYVVPQDLTTCIISVKMTTTADNCPVTVSTGELSININDVPSPPAILWQGSITPQGVICRNSPALLSANVLNATAYQWFKNGNITTPILESTTPIFEATEVGTYTMRYQNAAGCWSLLSEPIEIIQSSIPTLEWSIKPNDEEIFNTSKTYRIVSAPAGTDYSWRILKDGNLYYPTYGTDDPMIKLTPLGDKSSVVVSFPPMNDISFDVANGKLEGLELEVTASSPCGEAVIKKPFILKEGCTPISSISVEGTAAKLMLGDVVQYTANVSTGSAPYWYQGWVYLENINAVSGITWAENQFAGKGTLNISGNNIDFWCMTSDLPEYPNGIYTGQYKKLLIVPWTDNKSFSVPTFAVGKHYVMIEAANDTVGLGILQNNGTYTETATPTGCTTWKNPVKSTPKLLEVSINPNNIPNGPSGSGLDYTVFMGGKSCYDVHQTGDNATQAWGNNRLPLNVRPNDFLSTVNGNYVFSYTFKGGSFSIDNGYYSSNLTKNTGTWNGIKSSIQYMVDDPNNLVVSVIGNGTETAVLTLKPSVIAAATGRTRNTALKLTLYAIYKSGNDYYKDAIVISIQDAACGCPAKMSGSSWIMAMCHAAGADYNTDPYGTAEGAYGAYYKWGNKTPAATHSTRELNQVRAIKGTIWDMESQNPCPYGWRVATWAELSNIANTNLNARTTDSNGRQVRGYVPIRGGGYRVYALGQSYVLGIYENDNAHTWSANATSDDYTNNKYFYRTGDGTAGGNYTKHYGEMVRCVQEGSTYAP